MNVMVIEIDLVEDAVSDLNRVQLLLASRYGNDFRTLQRDIENLLRGSISAPEYESLEPDRVIAKPPVEIKALLDRARALGVI